MDVVGVRAQMPNNEPIVLLREAGGRRMVPIWIGWNEANAIAEALEGLRPPRPLTHDLLIDTLAGLGHRITEVHITELDGGTFYAVLLVDGVEISARSRPPASRRRKRQKRRSRSSASSSTASARTTSWRDQRTRAPRARRPRGMPRGTSPRRVWAEPSSRP